MRFKIQGGTTSDQNTTLCLTCRAATIISGPLQSDQIIAWGKLDETDRITFVVTACTGYSDKSLPSLDYMEDIAWILRSERNANRSDSCARGLSHSKSGIG